MPDTPNETAWHLDKKVPIALIVTLAVQTATAVWWASGMDSRLQSVMLTNGNQDGRIGAVESAVQAQAIGAATLGAQMDAVRAAITEVKDVQKETNDLLRQYIQGK